MNEWSEYVDELRAERDELRREIDDLREFEREYRARLREYFYEQLELLGMELPPAAPDDPMSVIIAADLAAMDIHGMMNSSPQTTELNAARRPRWPRKRSRR